MPDVLTDVTWTIDTLQYTGIDSRNALGHWGVLGQ